MFFLLISGNPVWWHILVHRSQMKERRTPRRSKHFSQNLDTQKWSNNPVMFFLFKLQSAFFPGQTAESLKKSAVWKCVLIFAKCRTEALPELDLFLLIPGCKGPGMVVEKRQVVDPWNFPGSRILVRSTFGIGIVVSSKRLVLQSSWWG